MGHKSPLEQYIFSEWPKWFSKQKPYMHLGEGFVGVGIKDHWIKLSQGKLHVIEDITS